MSIESDLQGYAPGALVELFELDATAIGGAVFRFHAGVNGLGNDVVWQGVAYTRFPVEAEGFEASTNGTLPRPKLRFGNVGGMIGALLAAYGDLAGAKVIRRRTLGKYLDAVNFPGGTNPDADPDAHFPDQVWFVDRKALETNALVELELAVPWDLTDVTLPRRQIIANVCTWRYRSAECTYAGGPKADINDAPTTDANLDACGKRLKSCELRFGKNKQLPYGGFPTAGKIR